MIPGADFKRVGRSLFRFVIDFKIDLAFDNFGGPGSPGGRSGILGRCRHGSGGKPNVYAYFGLNVPDVSTHF